MQLTALAVGRVPALHQLGPVTGPATNVCREAPPTSLPEPGEVFVLSMWALSGV